MASTGAHAPRGRAVERLQSDYIDLIGVHIWDAYPHVVAVERALDDLGTSVTDTER